MENPCRLLPRVTTGTVPYASIPRKDDSSDWFSVYRDLNLARTLKANLLVVGNERLVLSLVSSLVADVHPDFMIQCHDGLMRLPPRPSQSGMVVLRDVDTLDKVEQLRFLEWLDSASKRLQVVSTATAPLLRLVEARKFNPTLYYRLNTVYIDLTVDKVGRAIL